MCCGHINVQWTYGNTYYVEAWIFPNSLPWPACQEQRIVERAKRQKKILWVLRTTTPRIAGLWLARNSPSNHATIVDPTISRLEATLSICMKYQEFYHPKNSKSNFPEDFVVRVPTAHFLHNPATAWSLPGLLLYPRALKVPSAQPSPGFSSRKYNIPGQVSEVLKENKIMEQTWDNTPFTPHNSH